MSDSPYSPRLRTALVLTGTGTAGAYHAGALQALQEAAVKVDLVAGRGMGVAGALFAAVDGGAHLWGPRGLWRKANAPRFYRFKTALRLAAAVFGAGLVVLLSPLAVLGVAVLVYISGLFAALAGLESAGATVTAWFRGVLDLLFAPAALPAIVPRLVALALVAALAVVMAGACVAALRGRSRRRTSGSVWWRLVGAPLTAQPAVAGLTRALWHLIRGAAQVAQPDRAEVGRRYAELLTENLGQPGFRDVLVTTHDVDARRDLVFALLAEPHRTTFFGGGRAQAPESRAAETCDLGGVARDHLLDVLAGALSLPVATDSHLITFPAESYWRGETHRLCDRPEALVRLLAEVAAAGAEQVVVVSDAPPPATPHALTSGRSDPRGRAGEYLRAAETAAVRDAVSASRHLFRGVFEIRPPHNSVGPFDFAGAYDEHSDRRPAVAELVDRGYEDAYRQFIDPIVGASGDRLAAGGGERGARDLHDTITRGSA